MMNLFWEEVFRSFDAGAADQTCQTLYNAGIRYRRRAINLLESAMSANRGRTGSLGIDERYRYVYAVKVKKADVSRAQYVLRTVKR